MVAVWAKEQFLAHVVHRHSPEYTSRPAPGAVAEGFAPRFRRISGRSLGAECVRNPLNTHGHVARERNRCAWLNRRIAIKLRNGIPVYGYPPSQSGRIRRRLLHSRASSTLYPSPPLDAATQANPIDHVFKDVLDGLASVETRIPVCDLPEPAGNHYRKSRKTRSENLYLVQPATHVRVMDDLGTRR